jgi:hypothetical protein
MRDVTKPEVSVEMGRKLSGGCTLEERAAGLPPERQLLAMPDDVLHALSDDYLRSLPVNTQNAIRKRIGRPAE